MHMTSPGKEGGGGIRRIGWLAGSVGGVLLISLGLELLAHQAFGQTDMATLLLALYLAFWSSVLGIVGFFVLLTKWLMEWRRPRMDRVAEVENLSTTATAVVRNRWFTESDDSDRSRDFNRVA